LRRGLATGEAHDQLRAELDDDVVPPVADDPQRQVGECRLLLGQEAAHQRFVDLQFRRWSRHQ
jgi:hypothetical protein